MNDENEKLRKLLRDLPKVPARQDFEARLARRLAKGKSAGTIGELLAGLLTARRIPAFAFSLLAVALVGVISYYLYLRPSAAPAPIVPPGPMPMDSLAGERTVSVPEKQAPPAAAQRKQKKTQPPPPAVKPEGISTDQHLAAPPTVKPTEQPVQSNAIREEEGKVRMEAAPAAVRGGESTGAEKALPGVFNAAPRAVSKAVVPEMLRYSGALDSAARADSLKKDSLQRAQKKMMLRKPKKERE